MIAAKVTKVTKVAKVAKVAIAVTFDAVAPSGEAGKAPPPAFRDDRLAPRLPLGDNPAMPAPRRDLTQGPITRTLLLFALPTLGSSILQSLNGSINAIWVGRFLGERALAATANANLIMFLLLAVIFGFGMAATVLVGQAVGRRDVDAARRAMGSALGLSAVLSLAVAAAGWLAAPTLLRWLATDAQVFPLALAYLRVIFLAMPASFVGVLLMMGQRGFGDSLTPLWFMILSAAIDVSLNPVFILGLGPAPRLGIAGAATATLIAAYASLAAQIAFIQLRGLPIRFRGAEWRYLRPDPALVRIIVAKGVPMGLQMLVMALSSLILIGLVNRFGATVTAAFGVISQLWAYIQMPAMALGAAVSAMAAQNIGAGRWDRVGRIARAGVVLNVALTGALVVLVALVDRPVLGLFLPSGSPSLPIATHIHLVISWSFVLFGVTIVLSGVMRANGVVLVPLVILAVAALPVRFGFAWALLPRFGLEGLWWSFCASPLLSMSATALYFRFGQWRGARLPVPPPPPQELEEKVLASGEAAGRLQPSG